MLNFQKKKTRQNLQGLSVFMCAILAIVIVFHMASASLSGVLVTYIPQIVQLVALSYAMVHIRGSLR